MSSNMIFRLSFPTWDSLSNETKSLLSIFIENAVVAFRGDYNDGSDENKLTGFSGAVYMNPVVISFSSALGDYIDHDLGEYFGGGSISWYYSLIALFANNSDIEPPSSEGSPYIFISSTNGIPSSEYFPTTLLKKQSSVGSFGGYGYGIELYYSKSLGLPASFEVPMNIIPLVDGNINTNPNLVPTFLKGKRENPEGLHILTCPVDSSSVELFYSFHFRTSSFTIKYDRSNGLYVEKDLFYKIGVRIFDSMPYEPEHALPELSDVLSELVAHNFRVVKTDYHDTPIITYSLYSDNRSLYVARPNVEWDEDYSGGTITSDGGITDIGDVVVVPSGFVYESLDVLNPSFVLFFMKFTKSGISEFTDYVNLGYLYIKLYNEDGTPFTPSDLDPNRIHIYDIGLRSSVGGSVDYGQSDVRLLLTDQNMDGGFIATPYSSPLG